MSTFTFTVNGLAYDVDLAQLPADITLNTFLREHAQLTATKFMCLEGGCGACVVVIRGKHPVTGQLRTWAANSCLTLLHTCIDWEIVTCEGIGDKNVGYHPIQKRLAKMNGSQCGFCSPGFVMNMYGLLESKGGKVTMAEVEDSFGGNLCRCTGYRPILDTMKSFASDSNIAVPVECVLDIEDLDLQACPKTGNACNGGCRTVPRTALTYNFGAHWHWPQSVPEIFDALDHFVGDEEYILVAGNTAHGVYRRSPFIKHFIDVNGVPELRGYTIEADKLTLGANLTLTEAMDVFIEASKRRQGGFEYCQQLWNHFNVIANVPVRNMGTLAGNISIKKAHPEFPSDVYVTFESLDVHVVINEDAITEKTMPLSEYISSAMTKHVVRAFELKAYPKEQFTFGSYKVTPRAQNAHAYVNAAFLLNIERNFVKFARICFGGIRPDFTHAVHSEQFLAGRNLFDAETVSHLLQQLFSELEPIDMLPDPSPEYRRKLAVGLLYKFILNIAPTLKVKPEYRSGGQLLKRPLSSGQQNFDTNKDRYPVNQPVQKLEGLIQCSGEAKYMNDTLTAKNSVYCAFATATRVGANIEQIDASEALQIPEVIAFYSAKDIPGNNRFVDPEFTYVPEEIFCSGRVLYYDQPLGMVVAETSDAANYAATRVKVFYSSSGEKLPPVLPTLVDVLKESSSNRIHSIASLSQKLRQKTSNGTDFQADGIFEIGSQYHFSMEPQTTIAVPFEDRLQVWCATQWMDQTQCVIARMLKSKTHNVQLEVRRLGGAYGCKITRGNQVACGAALAAYKLNRPARFVQTIESMMNSNGKRFACFSEYNFHVRANGKMVIMNNIFYEDSGCTLNEEPVATFSVPTARNCYDFSGVTYHIDGQAVITDAPSHTWCRAPGTLEGIAMIENIMEHIAFETNIDPVDVRMANLKSGHKMAELLPRFIKSTEYRKRRLDINSYNKQNRWHKRGLGVAIMQYPLDYFGQFSATVAIYHCDGSVVISHGGIEMGQGLNTKVAQVAAYTLGIPLELIKIESSDTINGANSFITGGSLGSESLCYVVRKACSTLNDRLKPVKESLGKNATWKEIVTNTWAQSISMIASEHYKMGDMQNYVIYGLALTELEVDILTGTHQIRRVDILEDTGESLSPLIDVGQVEGAFVMALGYWLTEHLVYDRQTGQLLTNRTWTYKIPGAKDIPIDFRVELLQKNPNNGGILRSKATGEPPCCLAVSSIFAIQHALESARHDADVPREWIRLGAPTTPETIVLNAATDVHSFVLQ